MRFLDKIFGGGESEPFADVPAIQAAKAAREGNYYGERGDLAHAIRCFEKAISIHPSFVPAYISLSIAYRMQGEYQRALDVLSRAPTAADIGSDQPIDFAFEIAFTKAGVLIAKYQPRGFQGNVQDLLAALEDAKRLGDQPIQEHRHYNAATAQELGIQDFASERQEQMALVNGMLAEIRGSSSR